MKRLQKNELSRKAIHLLTSIFPILYISLFSNKAAVLSLLVLLVIFSISLEILRNRNKRLKIVFNRLFSFMLRDNEKNGQLTGATWLLIGFIATISIYPRDIAVPAIIFLTIGDSFAAIIGKLLPVGQIGSKHISGSMAGLIASLIVVSYLNQNISILVLFLGATVAMFIELIPSRVNDNLTIPIISGFAMQALNKFV